MNDTRAIVPLTVDPKEWRALAITEKSIEDVALSTSGLRSTFVFGGFDKIHVTPRTGSSMVARNKKTNRIALFMNEKFVKRVLLGSMTDRAEYDRSKGSRRGSMPAEYANQFVYAPENFPVDHAIRGILLHEFAHVWFSHLDYVEEHAGDESQRWLSNLVQDAMLNHHCGVPPFLSDFLPLGHPDLAVFSLTHIDWAVASNYRGTRTAARTELEWFSTLSKADLEDPKIGGSSPHYEAWRALVSLMQIVKKGTRVSSLVKWVLAYVEAIISYDLKIEDIGAMVDTMFPEWVKKRPNLPDHGTTTPPGKVPPPTCGYPSNAGGKPGAPSTEKRQAEDQKPEESEDEGPESDEPEESEDEGPESDEPEESEDEEIDRDKPFEFEGQEFEPVKPGELSPEFIDKIPEILSQLGSEAGDGENLVRFYKKTSDMAISKNTRNAVLKAAAKNLVRVAKQVLHLKPKASTTAVTIVPNRHPLHSDLARESALLLDTDPRYKRVLRSNEECRSAKVAMFIDVSGSTGDAWEKIFGFARALGKLCSLQVFQFSTRVVPLSASELSAGAVITTGGTNGNCVLAKMAELSSTVESFVVLGDRYYGSQSPMPHMAKAVRIMDVAITGGVHVPWFVNSARASVYWVNLNKDFEVTLEGTAADIAQNPQ